VKRLILNDKLSIADKGISINDLGFDLEELQGRGLDFFAREGARILLQVALEEEVSSFLMRGKYERGDEKDRCIKYFMQRVLKMLSQLRKTFMTAMKCLLSQ